MKNRFKKTLLCLMNIFCMTIQINANGNDLITDNRKTYQLAAQATQFYLLYNYEKGAKQNTCSPRGLTLCKVLSNLSSTTRRFYQPARHDLKQLAKETEMNFRYFDLSGSDNDRKTFIRSLINLLQATSPLLEGAESSECKGLIDQLSQKL